MKLPDPEKLEGSSKISPIRWRYVWACLEVTAILSQSALGRMKEKQAHKLAEAVRNVCSERTQK